MMPAAAVSYLENAFFHFALLQFLSTLSTLWSTFCCDVGKGFWGYSRIWKHERSFQVQYIMEILPVQGCCVKQFQTTNFSSWSMWGFYAMHNPHGHIWRPRPSGQDSFILPSALNFFPRKLWEFLKVVREFLKNSSLFSFCLCIITKLSDSTSPHPCFFWQWEEVLFMAL